MTYSPELVEQILPAVWDEDVVWGVQNPHSPDPDMPRSKGSPKEANTLWAHIGDVRWAWSEAFLPATERRALFLTYVMGWTQEEIGFNQEVSHQAVSKRIKKGLERLTNWLNNDKYRPGVQVTPMTMKETE